MSRFEKLNGRVETWAKSKGILAKEGVSGKGTPLGQHSKTKEETDELFEALFAQNNNLKTYTDSKGRTEDTASSIKHELAGCMVTLMVQAKLQNIDILDCLEMEITKIEKRSGKMILGTFVKDK